MPNYRNGNDEYTRKPKMRYENDYDEPEYEYDDEEDECEKEKKDEKCRCRMNECPFTVIVKIIPCQEKKHKKW